MGEGLAGRDIDIRLPRPWLDRRPVEHTAPAGQRRPYGMMSMASVGSARRAQLGILCAKHTVPGQR